MAGELVADRVHRLVQVDRHDTGGQFLFGGRGQEASRVGFELLEEDAVGGDPPERLAVSRARHCNRHWAAGAVAGQPDDPHVVAEVLAAELRPDAELAGEFEDPSFPFEIAEPVAGLAARGGERVEVLGRGVLGGLDGELGRGAADHDRQVVRRAGRSAQRAQGGVEEAGEALGVEQRWGFLEQEALVGRASALGHEHQLVLVARRCVDLDLGGQVVAGVALGEHVERGELGITQVRGEEGVGDALGDGFGVVEVWVFSGAGEHPLALVTPDDRCAGVLAARQHASCGDVGVLEQFEGHEAVIGRCLGIVQNRCERGQVVRAKQMGDVAHGLRGEHPQRLGFDLQEAPARGGDRRDVIRREMPVGHIRGARGKQIHVGVLTHCFMLGSCAERRACYGVGKTRPRVHRAGALAAARHGTERRECGRDRCRVDQCDHVADISHGGVGALL